MPERQVLPVLPLRGTVILPGPTITLSVSRPGALRALEAAMQGDRLMFAAAERTEREGAEQPSSDSLHAMGVLVRIGQVQMGLGGLQVMLTGEQRAAAISYLPGPFLRAVVVPVQAMPPVDPNEPTFLALYRETRERAVELGRLRGLSEEALQNLLESITDPSAFTDFVANYLDLPMAEKQHLLETLAVESRLRRVLLHVQRELELLRAQQEIKNKVAEEIGGRQRELYLREQLKAIRQELGEADEARERDDLRQRLERLDLPEEARTEVFRELGRLERMGPESMEAQVIRTFLQWVSELPWNQRTPDALDLVNAARVLDEDHYGLGDVKDRVLEFLSVRVLNARRAAAASEASRASNGSGGNGAGRPEKAEGPPTAKTEGRRTARALARGPILLFIGPPGVGKTSIAQSIARALGRKYVRAALGGVRDEADIRGHRRTYVGAMPGRIIQGMRQAGSKNPVFLLDEVDKLGVSFQGDPASALLEVLDPAQNHSFTDHYLGVPFDLSEVLFIATGNYIHNISGPLLDRMEVVEFGGYTDREKAEIARRFLIPRQLQESALEISGKPPVFTDRAIATIISEYTRESGVRQLERQIGAVVRKLSRRVATGEPVDTRIDEPLVRELLGRPRARPERAATEDEIGVSTGLYYTPAGGDIMFVEAEVRRRGSDGGASGDISLILTGQLGDVMKESARAALTYVTAHAREIGIPADQVGPLEAHVHVPAGAIPKDGPSAGVTIATALASALSRRRVRRDVAMTGEITLRGKVLPIGGVKEKLRGAHRAGIQHVILPAENAVELEDLPEDVRAELTVHPVSDLGEVLAIALLPPGEARPAREAPPGDRPAPPGVLHAGPARSASK